MLLGRRGLFRGVGSLLAAPAIVRIATIMPVRLPPDVYAHTSELLTLDQINREAFRLWKNSNAFVRELDNKYDDLAGQKIGASLRIRLSNENYGGVGVWNVGT